MKLDRKYEIAVAAVNSIARHDDDDQTSVLAFLAALSGHIVKEVEAHRARKDAKRDALLQKAGVPVAAQA